MDRVVRPLIGVRARGRAPARPRTIGQPEQELSLSTRPRKDRVGGEVSGSGAGRRSGDYADERLRPARWTSPISAQSVRRNRRRLSHRPVAHATSLATQSAVPMGVTARRNGEFTPLPSAADCVRWLEQLLGDQADGCHGRRATRRCRDARRRRMSARRRECVCTQRRRSSHPAISISRSLKTGWPAVHSRATRRADLGHPPALRDLRTNAQRNVHVAARDRQTGAIAAAMSPRG